jgi:hypothetical protein
LERFHGKRIPETPIPLARVHLAFHFRPSGEARRTAPTKNTDSILAQPAWIMYNVSGKEKQIRQKMGKNTC